MVMKRYPHGASGEFFFMKRAPTPAPDWIEICSIEHASGNVIDFPMIQDLRVAPLGRQPRLHRPQPVVRALRRRGPPRLPPLRPRPGARTRRSEKVSATALLIAGSLDALEMPSFAKTTGSQGIHVYVPIVRGPTQKQVWTLRQEFARQMEARDPDARDRRVQDRQTAEGPRPRRLQPERVGRTLASIYSVRPRPARPSRPP